MRLDCEFFRAPEAAADGLARTALRYDYDPSRAYEGTPFTDRGFDRCLPSST